MFQTRNALKRRISELEKDLEYEKSLNKIPNEFGLSKCKGALCNACEHAVFINRYGCPFLIGCDITVNCPDYKKKATLQ